MTTDYFSSRATVRKFTDRQIDDALLNSILERAMHAPTTGNMQLYSVIVTRDPDMKGKLAPLHFNQPAATGCDLMLTICADFNRFSRWCRLSDADPGYNNFLSFLSAMTDAVALTQQIVTIAEMEGLGTCYLGTVTYNAPEISRLLELPDLVVPVTTLALGYPQEAGEKVERLPLESWVHKERYRNDSDAEIIEQFKAKDEFEPNKGYVEENNKRSLAQVFTDIRYPRSLNEEVSAKLLAYLSECGFLKY